MNALNFLESFNNKLNLESLQKIGFKCIKLHIFGLVQGVGFRPFIYNVANFLELKGSVKNLGDCVKICIFYENSSDFLNIFSQKINLFLCSLLDVCSNLESNAKNCSNDSIKTIINIYFNKKNSILNNIFLPQNANIESISFEISNNIKKENITNNFIILESNSKKHNLLDSKLPLDLKICESCLKDLNNKNSRFYNYAFTTCINCGARYSILNSMPYDRENTQMKHFKMCECCKKDFNNPKNRRFHTQPISCKKCAINIVGYKIDSKKNIESKMRNLDAIKACAKELSNNNIVIFKGLGGYAYLANARNNEAINFIREIKKRKTKSFAVMANLETLEKIAIITPEIKQALISKEAPILLTLKSQHYDLSPEISFLESIAVMIPYTAMLVLLFKYLSKDFTLLYTSANKKGDIIAKNLDEILKIDSIESKINFIENIEFNNEFFILDYERNITHRMEDSILDGLNFYDNFKDKKIENKKLNFIRISRGFAPINTHFPNLKIKNLTASFGAMQKSSLAFAKDCNISISPYMSDLFSITNMQNFMDNFNFFTKLYGNPEVLITDKHNGYESTKIAHKIAKNLSKTPQILSIYHHHAHLNALLLESNNKEGVGVIFDGSGLGSDGSIWGGEFLFGNFHKFSRLTYFKPFRILGGEKHIKNNTRLTLSYALCNNIKEIIDFLEYRFKDEFHILESMQKSGLNSPFTSSVGRLFDIAAFILNLNFDSKKDFISNIESIEYEGQSGEIISTLALKYIKNKNTNFIAKEVIESRFNPYNFEIKNNEINISECFLQMFKDMQNISLKTKDSKEYEINKGKIALRFIDTLSFCILESLKKIGTNYAHFGGGVFANFMLNARLKKLLDSNKIQYFFPTLPCNDYSISLGQIAFSNTL